MILCLGIRVARGLERGLRELDVLIDVVANPICSGDEFISADGGKTGRSEATRVAFY